MRCVQLVKPVLSLGLYAMASRSKYPHGGFYDRHGRRARDAVHAAALGARNDRKRNLWARLKQRARHVCFAPISGFARRSWQPEQRLLGTRPVDALPAMIFKSHCSLISGKFDL